MSLYDELERILDCVQSELTAAGRTIPDEVFVSPGQVAFDTLCGQLWARVIRIYQSENFPEESNSRVKCNTALVAQIGVGITRCQTGFYRVETTDHPKPAEQSLDSDGLVCDAGALLRGMVCCYPALDDPAYLIAEGWTQLEPQGSVIGGEWTAFIEADLYCEGSPTSP